MTKKIIKEKEKIRVLNLFMFLTFILGSVWTMISHSINKIWIEFILLIPLLMIWVLLLNSAFKNIIK